MITEVVAKCVTSGCALSGREQTINPIVRISPNVYGRLDPVCASCNNTMMIARPVKRPAKDLGEQFLDDLQKSTEDRIKAQGEWDRI